MTAPATERPADPIKAEALDRVTAATREEWGRIDHVARVEEWGRLYYRRFGRLAPGKAEAVARSISSMDPENVAQCDAWHETGLAQLDAIMEVVRLRGLLNNWRVRLDSVVGDMDEELR